MKRLSVTLSLTLVFVLAAGHVQAQEWNDAQKEVWKTVETYTKKLVDHDVDGLMSYFHKDFTGWGPGAAVPSDFSARDKWIRFFVPKMKMVFHDMKPLAIKVHGDVAIVQYLSTSLATRGSDKPEWSATNWTDVLKKVDGKWMLIGDHGSEAGDDD